MIHVKRTGPTTGKPGRRETALHAQPVPRSARHRIGSPLHKVDPALGRETAEDLELALAATTDAIRLKEFVVLRSLWPRSHITCRP